jgi:hypothetical protein
MSDAEKMYVAIQQKLGGSVLWHELHPTEQMNFVQALNIIIALTSR